MPALTIARLPREDDPDAPDHGDLDFDWTAFIPDANLYFPFKGGTELEQVTSMKRFADYINLMSNDTPALAAHLQRLLDLGDLEGDAVTQALFAGTNGLDFVAADGTLSQVWTAANPVDTLLDNLATAGDALNNLLDLVF